MARVHRIGQTRTCHVYRFCTVGTVEERVQQRAEKKLFLEQMVNRGSHICALAPPPSGAAAACVHCLPAGRAVRGCCCVGVKRAGPTSRWRCLTVGGVKAAAAGSWSLWRLRPLCW